MSYQGYLRQSTSTTIKFGPFVDSSDGDTEEGALTINASDVKLSKEGGSFAAKNQASGLTHDDFGYYDCMLDATDTDTPGKLKVVSHPTGALIVDQTFHVLEEGVYDSLIASGAQGFDLNQQVNVGKIKGKDAKTLNDNLVVTLSGTTSFDSTSLDEMADNVLSRGVSNVEATANKNSLARVVLATQGWQTVDVTGLRINKTDGSEFETIPITTGTTDNLIISIG